MPLIDDLKLPLSEEERSRRAFLGMMTGGALVAAALGTGVTGVKYLWPEVLFEEETRFRIGKAANLAPGTVLILPEQKAFVVRTADGVFALSATCTHLGCLTQFERDQNRIFCPCHGSRYDAEGRVTNGPAPKPLPRLALTIEGDNLVLDTGQTVADNFVLKV
jgi:cytochrome b6-f complex iron-sulfur subunit